MLDSTGNKFTITVIGLGYIGLPTATLFAASGHKVFGFEVNNGIVSSLKQRKPHIHFHEPDLRGLVHDVLDKGTLIPSETIQPSDVFIICVPTPAKSVESESGKVADLSFVEAASRTIGTVLNKGNLVILESTVPPKTTEQVMGKILQEVSGLKLHEDFDIAHCPERVIPGRILQELRQNDRIIGANSEEVAREVKALYEPIVTGGQIHVTDIVTAEMCKLAENTYRDVNIALANELSMICNEIGVDPFKLIKLANRHPRVNILNPGPGVGGHCIAVDPWFIVEESQNKTSLIRTAREVNDNKPFWIYENTTKYFQNLFGARKIRIGILGLTYKADTDDLRESPSLKIANLLKDAGNEVVACDPYISQERVGNIPILDFEKLYDTADFFLITVPHKIYFDKLKSLKTKPFWDCTGSL